MLYPLTTSQSTSQPGSNMGTQHVPGTDPLDSSHRVSAPWPKSSFVSFGKMDRRQRDCAWVYYQRDNHLCLSRRTPSNGVRIHAGEPTFFLPKFQPRFCGRHRSAEVRVYASHSLDSKTSDHFSNWRFIGLETDLNPHGSAWPHGFRVRILCLLLLTPRSC